MGLAVLKYEPTQRHAVRLILSIFCLIVRTSRLMERRNNRTNQQNITANLVSIRTCRTFETTWQIEIQDI